VPVQKCLYMEAAVFIASVTRCFFMQVSKTAKAVVTTVYILQLAHARISFDQFC